MILHSADTELTIQTFQEKDIGADYLRWLNDKSAMRFSNQRFLMHTRSSCVKYLKGFRNTSNQFLAIHDRHQNLVGTMTMYFQNMHGTVDLGIMIGPEHSGKGIGTRAWLTLVTFLEEDINIRKITAGCTSSNTSMIRLAEKSGMALEGRRVQQEIHDEGAVDILLFGKICH